MEALDKVLAMALEGHDTVQEVGRDRGGEADQGARRDAASWLTEVLKPMETAEEIGRNLPLKARCVGPGPWIEALEEYYRRRS